MRTIQRRTALFGIAALSIGSNINHANAVEPYGPSNAEITIVVTDPLALPLACACVEGFAQRKYEKLADFLQMKLKKSVRVVWGDSIGIAKKEHGLGEKTLFIGKDSVVRFDTRAMNLEVTPLAQLTDVRGSVNQHGLFVVRKENPATSLLDLEGYQVLWGPEKCEEKSNSPKGKLQELEIGIKDGETCDTCTVAALKLVEYSSASKTVAVISSYAQRLLEGCGTIEKGELRIVGTSEEVPFISVFAAGKFTSEERKSILSCLLESRNAKDLLVSLESKNGFVAHQALAAKR
jgi:hypothetical protein